MAQMKKRVAKMTYDFSVDGGAISTITPAITSSIPIGAIITDVYAALPAVGGAALDSAADGGSVQVFVGTQEVSVVAAEAAIIDYKPALFNSLTAIEVTATADLKLAVSGEALTSGKADFYVEYIY